MDLKPTLQFEILFHPPSTRIEHQARKPQSLSMHQVMLDQLPPSASDARRRARIAIAGKIHKVNLPAYPKKIHYLRPARLRAGKRQTRPAREAIQ